MGAVPGTATLVHRAIDEELDSLATPDVRRMILHEALAQAGLGAAPADGALLAAFVDGALRRAMERVVGNDAADSACRRLIELARRSTGAPLPAPGAPLVRSVVTPGKPIAPPASKHITPVSRTQPTLAKFPTPVTEAPPMMPGTSSPNIPAQSVVPQRNATPPRHLTAPVARVSQPGSTTRRPTFTEAPSSVPARRDARVTSSPPPRSGPAVRQVKLTPRPRMRALSDASKYTPPPFRPSGDHEQSQQRPSQIPTHRPMPALSSYVIVVTENENKGEPLADALSQLKVHAFVGDGSAIPAAADVPNVIVIDARTRPVDEQTLGRLLWRMGTKVIVWGSDDALRLMRRSYGRADQLVRCHADVSERELAHVCQMLLG